MFIARRTKAEASPGDGEMRKVLDKAQHPAAAERPHVPDRGFYKHVVAVGVVTLVLGISSLAFVRGPNASASSINSSLPLANISPAEPQDQNIDFSKFL